MADSDGVVRRPERANSVKRPSVSAQTDDADETPGFFKTLGRLLMKHNATEEDAQEHAQGGLTRRRKIDRIVDDAVRGAKDDPV